MWRYWRTPPAERAGWASTRGAGTPTPSTRIPGSARRARRSSTPCSGGSPGSGGDSSRGRRRPYREGVAQPHQVSPAHAPEGARGGSPHRMARHARGLEEPQRLHDRLATPFREDEARDPPAGSPLEPDRGRANSPRSRNLAVADILLSRFRVHMRAPAARIAAAGAARRRRSGSSRCASVGPAPPSGPARSTRTSFRRPTTRRSGTSGLAG